MSGGQYEVIGQGYAAGRRPDPRIAAYLRPEVRQASSVWARVGPAAEQRTVRKLADDLRSGRWTERNPAINSLSEMDLGARLLIA